MSSVLPLEARFACPVLKVATKNYCFVEDTFLSMLKDLHELTTHYVLHHYLNLVLAESLTMLAVREFKPAPVAMTFTERRSRVLPGS